jgi:Mrp family chromosome partitioning ATPase
MKERTDTSADSIASIAARVETEALSPAALLVTSARATDGTTMIASRLAEVLVGRGYQVVVVDARSESAAIIPGPKSAHLDYRLGAEPEHIYDEVILRDLDDRFTGSRREIVALIARLRSRYDYVIVDAPSFNRGSMPTLFADVCNALLITVAQGRLATSDDRRINSFLDGSAKPAIGIVSTTKLAIRNFDAIAMHRSRSLVPLHEIVDERPGRVSVVAGSI